MRRFDWFRILLCGLIAGFVWYILSNTLLAIFGQDLLAVIDREQSHPKMSGLFFFGIDLLMGVWGIWLYVAIRSRYGVGAKTAVIAGIAWWFIKNLQSMKWVGIGLLPLNVIVVPLIITFPAVLAASVIGVWFYERTESRRLAMKENRV